MVSTYFIKITDNNIAPAFFVLICAVLVSIIVLKMKETAFTPLPM